MASFAFLPRYPVSRETRTFISSLFDPNGNGNFRPASLHLVASHDHFSQPPGSETPIRYGATVCVLYGFVDDPISFPQLIPKHCTLSALGSAAAIWSDLAGLASVQQCVQHTNVHI